MPGEVAPEWLPEGARFDDDDRHLWLEGARDPIWVPEGAYYDPTLPVRFVAFSKAFLCWPSGPHAGQPAVWAQWQLDRVICPAFGLRWEETGILVTRTVFLFCARGNGKTALAAAIGVFCLSAMREPTPEVDLFAVSREQAMRMWQAVDHFIRASDDLCDEMTIYDSRKSVYYGANDGQLVVRSGDAEAEVGLNPSCALVDELLSQKSRDLWDVVTSSAGKREHTLIMAMTTPSLDSAPRFARQEYQYAKRVEGDRAADPSYLPAIFEADPKDDPFAVETWYKAAPALRDGFLDIGIYHTEAARAKLDPNSMHQFRVFRLAIWSESGHSFLPMAVWDANACEMPTARELLKYPCYGGLDMSGTADLTSWCMLWAKTTDEMYVSWRHWCTEKMYHQLVDWTGGMFRVWVESEASTVRVVPGDWIEGPMVAQQVLSDYRTFKPWSIGLDSMRSREMNRLLSEEIGIPTQLLNQSGRSMEAATERIEALAHLTRLKHSGDPVARWMASCTHVQYDALLFPKLVKSDLNERNAKIDAIAALAMAMDRRLAWEAEYLDLVPPPRAVRI